jgi:hypothetical protein
MIAYRDFAPKLIRQPFFSSPEYESPSALVGLANKWIQNSKVKVINVETVVLPAVQMVNTPQRIQTIRVWYEDPG